MGADNVAFQFVQRLGSELSAEKLDLPPFPDVALRVKAALESPDVSTQRMASVVSADPVLSARLLKIANSAAMSNAGHISDIRTAVTRIGFNMVYNTAVSIAMNQLLGVKLPAPLRTQLDELWLHSVQVAAIAHVLAKKLTRINPDEAMLGGLLHDIGKIYVLMRAGEYPDLFGDSNAFDAVVKEWHTGVGAAILQSWNFSAELVMVVDEHELLSRNTTTVADLVDVVMVANLFANHDLHTDQIPDWDHIPALARLRLTSASAVELLAESQDQFDSVIAAMNS